jgi:tRNA 2-thiocytidine biosynthesis protein TtcA
LPTCAGGREVKTERSEKHFQALPHSSVSRTKRNFPRPVQNVFRNLGKALARYEMIAHGDRILVGVSGIDSLCLLWLLRERLAWIPVTYTLKAVYIDLGFDAETGPAIEDYLRTETYDYTILKTDIGITAHSAQNRENPCFYCARQRRKRLFQICGEEKFNKIAFGHHLEDINATFFINVIYGGSVSTMNPCQPFFDGRVTVIRPLAMIYKQQIEHLASIAGVPGIDNPCPSAQTSQRKEVAEMLSHFYKKDPRIRYNIFNALSNVRAEYLLK